MLEIYKCYYNNNNDDDEKCLKCINIIISAMKFWLYNYLYNILCMK